MIPLPIEDSRRLEALHTTFADKACKTGCSVAAASFLIIGALVVIGCASLCLTLPGVNVLSHVILPGVVPGCIALLLSIPFVVIGVRKAAEKVEARKELIDFVLALFAFHHVEDIEDEARLNFIVDNFFDRRWTTDYSMKLISDLKARFPDEEERPLLTTLDDVLGKVYKKQKST